MSNKIRASNLFAEIEIPTGSGDFFPIFCAKSATLTSIQEEIEVTSVNSGRDREYEPGMRSSTFDVSGITSSDNTDGRVAIYYLWQAAQRAQVFSMRFRAIDEDGNPIAISFNAFSTTLSLVKPDITSFSQSSASFRITGSPDISDIIPDPVELPCDTEDPLYLDGAEGDAEVSDPLLEQDDVVILGVGRSGDVYNETTGTPGNLEFKFVGGAGNGLIQFDATNPFNPGGEQVWVLYKIDP
jgi:hypothetical protein